MTSAVPLFVVLSFFSKRKEGKKRAQWRSCLKGLIRHRITVMTLISKDKDNSCASFDKCQKFDRVCPPTHTHTQKFKSRFTIFSSPKKGK